MDGDLRPYGDVDGDPVTLPILCHQPAAPTTCTRCRVLVLWHVGDHMEKRYHTPALLRWVADARDALFEEAR